MRIPDVLGIIYIRKPTNWLTSDFNFFRDPALQCLSFGDCNLLIFLYILGWIIIAYLLFTLILTYLIQQFPRKPVNDKPDGGKIIDMILFWMNLFYRNLPDTVSPARLAPALIIPVMLTL